MASIMGFGNLSRFCCQNRACARFGQRDAGNMLVVGHFAGSAHRLHFCRTYRYRFSEFKGTSFFNFKLPHDKILVILRHLAEGCGVRQTACLVGSTRIW